MVCEHSDTISVPMVMEMGNGPNHRQSLQFGNTVILLPCIQGSAGESNGVQFPITLILGESSSKSFDGRISFKDELSIECWVGQNQSCDEPCLEFLKCCLAFFRPHKCGSFAGELVQWLSYFCKTWDELPIIGGKTKESTNFLDVLGRWKLSDCLD